MSEYQAIHMQLPVDLVEKADAKAKAVYKSRTEYIKDLIIEDLKQPVLPL